MNITQLTPMVFISGQIQEDDLAVIDGRRIVFNVIAGEIYGRIH